MLCLGANLDKKFDLYTGEIIKNAKTILSLWRWGYRRARHVIKK